MEKINFEDIRVGDRIRVSDRTVYANKDIDTDTVEFTVIDKTATIAEGTYRDVYDSVSPGRTITLLDRPKPTLKVGDTITGEQVADLPDGAVFDLNDGCVALRYKIDGQVYSARGSVLSPANYRTLGYHILKIVFLPEA